MFDNVANPAPAVINTPPVNNDVIKVINASQVFSSENILSRIVSKCILSNESKSCTHLSPHT